MNNLKIKTEKGIVEKIRSVRDTMNMKMQDMNLTEIKAYLANMRKDPSEKPLKS
jgi:hypothetical protein